MGKSSKKSATKVDAAPASKPVKKGKREAEEVLEKLVSAKKQKKDEAVEQPAQKVKIDAKTQKKKKQESSSSEYDSSSSDEEEKVKAATKKGATVTKQPIKKPVKDSSSEESSSSDESSSDEDEKVKAATKKDASVTKPPVKKPVEESSSEESSSDESSSDEEAAPPAKKPQVAAKKGTVKKVESSSSSSDDDSDESDDESDKVKTSANKPAAVVKKPETSTEEESSSEEESSDDEAPAKAAAAPPTKNGSVGVPSKKGKEDSSSSDSSDDDSDSDSDEKTADDEEEKLVKTPQNKNNDVKMVDAETAEPKTPATPNTGKRTLFVGNLPYEVERSDVENFFKDAGEIVDVRLAVDSSERFKGYGHVEFATAEAAQNALKLDGGDLGGRSVRLDLALDKGERGSYDTPYSGKEKNSFQRGQRSQGQKVFIRGFDKNQGEDEIKSALKDHFKSCGEISYMSVPVDRETGDIRGIAYIEFNDDKAFNSALGLNQSEFQGEYLQVEEAKPRDNNRSDGSWSGGRGRDQGFRGRGRSGRDSGRSGRGRGRNGGRFGRDGDGGGRGTPYRSSASTGFQGKKKTFNDDD